MLKIFEKNVEENISYFVITKADVMSTTPQRQDSVDEKVRLPGKPVPKNAIHVDTVKIEEPKFVPYEPYKAAVNDIYREHTKSQTTPTPNKQKSPTSRVSEVLTEAAIPFPLKIATLPGSNDRPTSPASPTSIPLIRVNRRVRTYSGQVLERNDNSICNEEHSEKVSSPCSMLPMTVLPKSPPPCHCWTDEKNSLQNEIRKLKEEKTIIESQLQTQTQVNAELKKLLVASVGEDIQQRVQFLTEDKARLAEDIVNYSQRLINDYEEMEKLSIQCDVWRSKYMASSVMVDELAKWKAVLSRKYEEMKQVIEMMLTEHNLLRHNVSSTALMLQNIKKAFDPTNCVPVNNVKNKSTPLKNRIATLDGTNGLSILQLSAYNTNLTDELQNKLLGNKSGPVSPFSSKSPSSSNRHSPMQNFSKFAMLPARTQAEECAYQILTGNYHLKHNDLNDDDLLPMDLPMTGSQYKFGSSNIGGSVVPCNGCGHCCGEIKQV